jgi:low temperature requirement protein LtrA
MQHMTTPTGTRILRARDDNETRVSFAELFFDLIYVFAVTQLSHTLLGHLTFTGVLETLILWFAVWLAWQYTCWFTNWFDPETMPVRIVLFVLMLLGLLMAASLPEAFGERGLLFACCYSMIQVGRTCYGLVVLKRDNNPLAANFARIVGWSAIAAVFWIGGGLVQGESRIWFWVIGVACDYLSPMFGFWLPRLGRSHTSDWTVEGGHMVERCALFVILALGESILVTGATIAKAEGWDASTLAAFFTAFVGSIAMWWMYFDTSSKAATQFIVHSGDPGRYAAYFHYIHVLLVAGIIVTAVGNDLSIDNPYGHVATTNAVVILGGPTIYIIGNAIYKRVIHGNIPLSHMVGMAALVLATPFAFLTDLLIISIVTTLILAVVAGWEALSRRKLPSEAYGEPA